MLEKGKEKKSKKNVGKKPEVEKDVEGTKAMQGTKKRKVSIALRQLRVPKVSKEIASVTLRIGSLGEEATHAPPSKARVRPLSVLQKGSPL